VIDVRPASEADGPVLARIDLATRTPAASLAPPPADVAGYLFFDERTKPSDVLVAELDGVVAGWVKVQSASPAVTAHAHVLEIGGLAVDPAHQGAGVGRRLVEAAVQECSRLGARKVTLRVLRHNVGARRLYEKGGFLPEGVLRGEFLLEESYVDDVLMARHLVAPV